MSLIVLIIDRILNAYLLLILIYVMMSWIPNSRNSKIHQIVSSLVEPYLDVFRNKFFVIGIIDFSAIVGYMVLYMAIYGIRTLI
ncbi:MAG: YggT family protein [Mycoplasmatales bacterium]